MDVDRHVEFHGRRKESIVARVIEEATLGRTVDERADKVQVLHGAREFGSAGVGALHRQHRETGEAIRMAGNGRRKVIVHFAGHGDAIRAGHEIGPGAGVGEHLNRNAGLIHRLQALLGDLGQKLQRVWALLGRFPRPKAAAANGARVDFSHQRRNREMLFECDHAHRQCPSFCLYLIAPDAADHTAAIASISRRKFGFANPRRMHNVLPGGCLPKYSCRIPRAFGTSCGLQM